MLFSIWSCKILVVHLEITLAGRNNRHTNIHTYKKSGFIYNKYLIIYKCYVTNSDVNNFEQKKWKEKN